MVRPNNIVDEGDSSRGGQGRVPVDNGNKRRHSESGSFVAEEVLRGRLERTGGTDPTVLRERETSPVIKGM